MTDVAAEVAELRTRGVAVVDYDEPGLVTVDGVADVGLRCRRGSSTFGNSIGLLQFKDKGSA